MGSSVMVILLVACACSLAWKPVTFKCDNVVYISGQVTDRWSFNASTQRCDIVKARLPSRRMSCSQSSAREIRDLLVHGSGSYFKLIWNTESNSLPIIYKVLFYVKEIDTEFYPLPDCQYIEVTATTNSNFTHSREIFQSCTYRGRRSITVNVIVFSLTNASCATLRMTMQDLSDGRPFNVTFKDNTANASGDQEDTVASAVNVKVAVTSSVAGVVAILGVILIVYCKRHHNRTLINTSDDTCNTYQDRNDTADHYSTLRPPINRDIDHVTSNDESEHTAVQPYCSDKPVVNQRAYDVRLGVIDSDRQPRMPRFMQQAMLEINLRKESHYMTDV